jgi:hypothetical protein
MAAAPYVVPALKKHTATVIMAHGLGDRSVTEPNIWIFSSLKKKFIFCSTFQGLEADRYHFTVEQAGMAFKVPHHANLLSTSGDLLMRQIPAARCRV